jgi:hypothetical protein
VAHPIRSPTMTEDIKFIHAPTDSLGVFNLNIELKKLLEDGYELIFIDTIQDTFPSIIVCMTKEVGL